MNANDIIINGAPVCGAWGLRMGEGFLSQLMAPLTPKAYIENESRLEDGKRIEIPEQVRMEARDLTLEFCLVGETPQDLADKKAMFLAAAYAGAMTLQVPQAGSEVYRLAYRGNSGEYGMNAQRTLCRMSLKFTEPDPTDRGAQPKSRI